MSPQLPSKLYAEAVVRSASGESLLRSSQPIDRFNIAQFHAASTQLQQAEKRLRSAGFEVLDRGTSSINIVAAPEVYRRVFGAKLEIIQRPVVTSLGQPGVVKLINSVDSTPFGEIDIARTGWGNILDGVAINEPAFFLQQPVPSAIPPQTNTRYLQVPYDLAKELGANLAHENGITGKGIKAVIVDSGCYAAHPFFQRHNYQPNVVLGPGSSRPELDTSGHGTGVAANLLAIAPHVDLTVLKSDVDVGDGKFRNVNSTAAFRKAVSLGPKIISCSWGSDLRSPYQLSSAHRLLAAAIADAVRQGVTVVFAAGNGHWGFPSQHPDVIAVGGVYKHLEGSLKGRMEASNYASSFVSSIYPGRRVPDVCGLVGRLPNAAYIMLPVPPGSEIDKSQAAMGDETQPIDGWAAFSGTSSAAPQLAGACALLEELVPELGPLKIKQILQETASDILEGSSHPGSGGRQARAGPDLATGHGLAVAYKAIETAKEAQKQQRQQNTVFYQGSTTIGPNGNPESRQISEDLHRPNYQEKGIMSLLDESIVQDLRINLDEIQVDLNTYFNAYLKDKYPKLESKNIELNIHEGNFVERTPESEAIACLLDTLRAVLDNGKVSDKSKIRKNHILAAHSLLSHNKCHSLVKEVLFTAITLNGKETKYLVNIDSDNYEISLEQFSRLLSLPKENFEIKELGGQSFVVESSKKIQLKAQIQITSDTAEERKKIESIPANKLKGKILREEVIDRDEIAELALKALSELGDSSLKETLLPYKSFSEVNCYCRNGVRYCLEEDGWQKKGNC